MGRPRNTIEKVFARLVPVDLGYETPCLVWPGAKTTGGYGHVRWNMKMVLLHRLIFAELVAPIDEGFQVDHLCHDRRTCSAGDACPHRACANPEHLDAVTSLENWRRSGAPSALNAEKVACDDGHALVGDNLIVIIGARGRPARSCRICRNRRAAGYERAKRAAQLGLQSPA